MAFPPDSRPPGPDYPGESGSEGGSAPGPGGSDGQRAPSSWSREEIAERARRALTAQGPPGKRRPETEGEVHAPRSSQGTTGRISGRRRYLVHSRAELEEKPLEPPVPWLAFFSLATGLMVAVLGGALAPIGLAAAFVACVLGGYSVFRCIRTRKWQGAAPAVAGIALAVGFATIHYSAYTRGRPALPSIAMLGNRGTGNSVDYQLLQTDTDFTAIGRALKSYYAYWKTLPPYTEGNLGANSDSPAKSPAFGVPTFRVHVMSYDRFDGLTTPIAFLSKYPLDPFAPSYWATYSYYVTRDQDFALLLSPGPDGQYQIDPEKDFIPKDPKSRERLMSLRWDPTNGTRSAGDLWYIAAMPVKPKVDPATGLPLPANR